MNRKKIKVRISPVGVSPDEDDAVGNLQKSKEMLGEIQPMIKSPWTDEIVVGRLRDAAGFVWVVSLPLDTQKKIEAWGMSDEFKDIILYLHSNVGRNDRGQAVATKAKVNRAAELLATERSIEPLSKTAGELYPFIVPALNERYIRDLLDAKYKDLSKQTEASQAPKPEEPKVDAAAPPHVESAVADRVIPAAPITTTTEPQKEVQLAPVDTTVPKMEELTIAINDSVLLERIRQVERDTSFSKEELVRFALKDYFGLYWDLPLDMEGYIDLINDSKIKNGWESQLEHWEETGESVSPAQSA